MSVWLGVYIVTRSRTSWIAWSSGLTLWCLAWLFANILLLMLTSAAQADQPYWLSVIFPVWPKESNLPVPSWTQSWAVGLGLIFWYQTTVFVIPGGIARWRRYSLYGAYLLGIISILIDILSPHLFRSVRTDPIFVDTQRFRSIYPIYAAFLIFCSGVALFNLREAKRLSASIIVKKQLNMLIMASLIVCIATILSVIGAIPGQSIAVFWISSLLVVAVFFFGFGVIRYSALLGQRVLRRDLAYSAISVGLVVLLYMGMFFSLEITYNIPQWIVVFLIPLVILTHSVTEEVRQFIEHLIYDRRTRMLRSSLISLSKLAVEQSDLGTVLSRSLETICYPVQATYGVILVFEQDSACPNGFYRWHDSKQPLFRKDFEADDVKHIEIGGFPEPFLEATLLIPLYSSQEQIGAILLGRPEFGIRYSREDLLLLQDPADHITELILKNRRINEYLDQFVQLPIQQNSSTIELIPATWVEDALQNFCDIAYLGDSPLANLKQVKVALGGTSFTYLDKGRAVCQVVTAAVEKLRPGPVVPNRPISREWYPYLILHDAYFEGMPNRDIISKLYISEGTFHRTRRSAIRSVTRVLTELEAQLN